MHEETSNTWLQSLQDAGPDASGWHRLLESYGPFVRGILIRKGLQDAAADDVVQNVMTIVVNKLPAFERQRTGSFRSWLRQITVNCLRDYFKSSQYQRRAAGSEQVQELVTAMEDPKSEFTLMWNRDHANYVVNHLLKSVANDFTPTSIEVFQRLALREESVDDVAKSLNMSTNACFIARSRVLKRLRALLQEQFGDDQGLVDFMG